MSSIVADELAKIKSFETETEKRRSELTLNELNYISDKQLHKKDGGEGGGSDLWPEVPFVLRAGDHTPTPYEDLPQWAKDLPEATPNDGFVPLEVLKNEMPQSPPATGDSLLIVVYYDGLPGLRSYSTNCLIVYDDVALVPSGNYIYSSHAISHLGDLYLNFVTGEAFAVGGK